MSSDKETESEDDKFSPTESGETADSSDEFLNKKTGEYAPKMLIKTVLIAFVGIGFAIGYAILAVVVSGGMCMFEMISSFTSQSFAAGGGADLAPDALKSELMGCTRTKVFGVAGIVSGLIGGSIASYPSYKLIKSLAGGNYLRSLI